MAYIKRDFYTVPDDGDIKEELLEVLIANGIKETKAKQLVYYPRPMSLIRWSRYLTAKQMEKYLVINDLKDDDYDQEDYINFNNMGF